MRSTRSSLAVCLALLTPLLDGPDTLSAADPAPLGGLQRLHIWPEDPANLVSNPSFEQHDTNGGVSGWLIGDPVHLAPAATGRTGGWGLELRDADQATYTPIARQSLALAPGWYTLRGWARATDAGTLGSTAGGRISLYGLGIATDVVNGTTAWRMLQRREFVVRPGDAPSLRIEAYQRPPGTVLFDDIGLHRLAPPAAETFLLYPNYRGTLFADRPQLIRVRTTVRPEELRRAAADLVVRLSLHAADGTVAASREFAGYAGSAELSVSAALAPQGRYELRTAVLDRSTRAVLWTYPPYTIVKLAAAERAQMRTFVDPDNTAVFDGRRRFVLGLYDTTGYSSDPGWYEPRISKIAEAPFNLYINYWLGRAPDSALQALGTTLRSHGMRYLHTVNTWYETAADWAQLPPCGGQLATVLGQAAYVTCRSKALGAIPGIAGWYTADEAAAESAPPVFAQYASLRSGHRDGLTFIAQNSPHELGRWRDAADVIGVDPYPIYNIPEGTLSPFEMVSNWVDDAQRATERSRPVWAVIQYFPFGGNGHWPTFAELRSMSYLAVVSGARGLLYWSYGAKGLSWVQDPALREEYWQRLVRVTREVHALEPVLLSAERPRLVTAVGGGEGIRFISRVWGRERYVIAVNTTAQPRPAVTFTLRRPIARVEALGEARTISAAANTFSDAFGPYEAHVYRIGRRR
jgi:hypothetical protein